MANLFSNNPASLFGNGTTAAGELFQDEDQEGQPSLFSNEPTSPEVEDDENGLPSLPTFNAKPKPDKVEEKQKEEKPAEVKSHKPKQKKRVQKYVVHKKEVQQVDPMKKALSHFQNSMNQQFESISHVIESLQPADELQGAVLPKDQILRQIQDAVTFAEERDSELRAKQFQIDRINAGEFENDERKLLREKISELNDQLEEETAKTNEIEQSIIQMQEQFAQMTDELEQLEPNSQNSQTRLRNVIKRDIERANMESQTHKEATEKQMEEENEQIKILKEQTEKFQTENSLYDGVTITTVDELNQFKDEFRAKVKSAIDQMVAGVNRILEKNLRPKKDYGGDVVHFALKATFQKVGMPLLEPDKEFPQDDDLGINDDDEEEDDE